MIQGLGEGGEERKDKSKQPGFTMPLNKRLKEEKKVAGKQNL